jgi:hypothetical protein
VINIKSSNKIAKEILNKAFVRSHGNFKFNEEVKIYCFISPNEKDEVIIQDIIKNQKSKVLIFGKISNNLAALIGLILNNNAFNLDEISFSHEKEEDKSNLVVKYNDHILNKSNALKDRYFYRFDFTDEWNNLAYGSISTDDSIWSVCNSLDIADAQALSYIFDNEEKISIFSSLKDFDKSSVLYINREVGTIDGLDWSVVEEFLTFYRNEELPSLPLILDIPEGCVSVASSRLDCDQSIINSKPIVDLYKKYNINISLAISTGINISQDDISFLNDFFDNDGAVLSHTINHHYYWGENYNIAYDETSGSKKWIEKNVENLNDLKYAVSPFHSNKPYSVQALNDADYKGFISGIIHNDPEFLIATSGEVPFVNGKIVTHSQQCMFHGDSYHRTNNSLRIYKQSFENHYNSSKLFGYLDHPFGDYTYGWNNEEERLSVHEEFINYINSYENVKWMTCIEILDFVTDKSNIDIHIDENNNLTLDRKSFNSKEKIKVLYKNKEYIC